ncbi:3-isopropylmalate dehydratase [Elizabethkingia anophelis]|nr:3-isopropylmalate dehydratase [Terrimonas sp.]MDV3734891.1 3-isopropylmalate dehydratase [Elizabethkingia anophelis]MDV3964607.1 3-isopropylmalate dehydratase [Elizabethkingia anophelis]OJY93890.1 MAG: 3-isopropylmalate dehydratase [Sphingobacteriales bacterium 40-81]
MKIRDKKGEWIEVTDLKKAIQQAGWYKEYQHDPPTESDKERQAYWADMHEKLLELKAKHTHNT